MVFSVQISTIYPCANAQISYPSPYWEYSPTTPRVGDIITFNALSFEKMWNERGESTIVSLIWHFGDGTSATGALVNHTYTDSGTYLAGVTATDDRGYGGTTEYQIQVEMQTPITVYVSQSSDTIYTGQEVTISGNLTYNSTGVPDTWVSLSSKTYLEGATWNEIATVKTDVYGNYSVVWKPTSGYYQVRAMWAGNSTYPETSVSVILHVKDFGDLITEFSSNSTIAGLNFNLTTLVLRFSAEGPSGTSGYVNITLEKDPTFDPQTIQVLFDGQPIEYHVDSTNQYWLLFFTYTHSTHDVVVNFKAEDIPEFPSWIILLLFMITTSVVIFYRNRLRRKLVS
jgi:PKD repeat protein